MHFVCVEGKLAGHRFPSWCNVFLGNAFVLVIEIKLACIRFPIQSNVVFHNTLALVLEAKLLNDAIELLAMHLWLCFPFGYMES